LVRGRGHHNRTRGYRVRRILSRKKRSRGIFLVGIGELTMSEPADLPRPCVSNPRQSRG
jgi:hypothetical protein